MHTPGPWRFSEVNLKVWASDDDTCIARLALDSKELDDNGVLIAASPALLQIAQDCLHQLSTDSDLDNIAGADKYRELVKCLKRVIYAADPGCPQLQNYYPDE